MEAKTLQEVAQEAADQIQGKTLAEVFNDGPRRLFVEHQVPRHGIYRLYIARPFGVRKAAGQRWRIQITVQFDGQDVQHSVNDGHITCQFEALGEVIVGAAEQVAEHIRANGARIHDLRRQAMQAVQPNAITVDGVTGHAPVTVTGCDGGRHE